MLGQNKTIGNKAERFVMKRLRQQGYEPTKAPSKKGYDIKTKKNLIEVKGTNNANPSHFALSALEFHTACGNKNYQIY